jgi:putative phosphoesterase
MDQDCPKVKSRMKIGVIADTHGYLDPQVAPLFAGVDRIIHAGDIGPARIIAELGQIAPVTAVLGNNDAGLGYAGTAVLQFGGRKFLVHHLMNPQALTEAMQQRLEQERPDVVIFGHTHRLFQERIGPMLFLNPGYAGKPRANLSRSVALVHCEAAELRIEVAPLGS